MEIEGIITLENLSELIEKKILTLYGIEKSTMPKLNNALAKAGYSIRKK